ncbi:MAG: hypothetical protein KAY09_00965 [Nitrospira sp.]|nr:hypothetical protein [Nitrospira sp.]
MMNALNVSSREEQTADSVQDGVARKAEHERGIALTSQDCLCMDGLFRRTKPFPDLLMHDLLNCLTNVIGYGELVQQIVKGNDKAEFYMGQVVSAGKRAQCLLDKERTDELASRSAIPPAEP